MRRNAAILVGIIANRGTATKEDLEKSIPRLIELSLNDEETAAVKKRSVEALGYIKSPRATEELVQTLKTTTNFKIRKKIIKALARIGDQEAALALINIIRN